MSELESMPSSSAIIMQNELVLSEIASHLPLDDLCRLRSTCSKWNDACVLKIEGKHSPLILATETPTTNVQKSEGEDRYSDNFRPKLVNMSEYTNFLRSPSRCSTLPLPFRRYTIPAPTRVNYKQMSDLFSFSACGAHAPIKQLQVDDCRDTWENMANPNWKENGPAKMDMDILRQIVFEWTPGLTELEILLHEEAAQDEDGNGSDQEEEAAVAVTRIVKDIPNLRRLNVYLEVTPPPGLLQLLLDLLSHAPSLKSFSLYGTLPDSLQIPSAIYNSMPQLLCKLTCLSLPQLEDDDIRSLIDLASTTSQRLGHGGSNRTTQPLLRLKQLGIQIDTDILDEDNEGETLLGEFLQIQATSLVILEIDIVGVCENDQELETRTPYCLPIPHLPLLRYFRRDRMGMAPILVVFGGLNAMTMSNALPTLKRFEYCHINHGAGHPLAADGEDVCTDDVTRMLHPGVTELELQVPFDAAGVSAIASRFPALTRLELTTTYASRSQLSDILWTLWPQLQSMTIDYLNGREDMDGLSQTQPLLPTLELDEWLSGIPKSKHENLRAELRALGSERISLERLGQLQAEHKNRPGLSDLCHLKKFILRAVEPAGMGKGTTYTITDIGGYFGLALANPDIQHMAIIDESWAASEEMSHTTASTTTSTPSNETSVGQDCREFIKRVFSPNAMIAIDV